MYDFYENKITDKEITQQLEKILNKPQYEKWNFSLLNSFYMNACGLHGSYAQHIGTVLLYNYVKWIENTTLWYEYMTYPFKTYTMSSYKLQMYELTLEYIELVKTTHKHCFENDMTNEQMKNYIMNNNKTKLS